MSGEGKERDEDSPVTPPPPEHRPVMLTEVLQALDPQSRDTAVDGCFGLGGHSLALLRHVDQGSLLGIERDPWVLAQGRERLAREAPAAADRVTLVHGSFADLDGALDSAGLHGFDLGLLDLGLNSVQIDRGHRGFHRDDEELDLRYDSTDSMTASAATLLSTWSADEIADVLHGLGGERLARSIARALVWRREKGRPVTSSRDLAGLVAGTYRHRGIRRQRIHPVTRTVQALRMAVNDELGHLARGLTAFLRRLNVNGRLAVITFHSGEARLVKRSFTDAVKGRATDLPEDARFEWITPRVVRPNATEVASNPRSRSAQLRAVRRVA